MAFNSNITAGAPPLLWSDVHEAFIKVNENFDILVATVGDGSGLTPVNFETLDTGVKPTTDNLYDIGDITHKWRGIYSSEYSTVDPLNGLWAGNAQIKGIGFTVNLPANSTVGGDPLTGIGTSLIIDPDKTFFKSVQVDNGNQVVAADFAAVLNLNSGTAVQLVVDSAAESITVNNTGVTSLSAGAGISVSAATGSISVANTGVRSLSSITALPSGRTAGAGINIDNSTGDGIKITNAGVLSISNGVGITVSTDVASGDVTITNSAPAQNSFANFEINGDSGDRISADATSDIFYINSGAGITLTKDTGTDTLTFAVNPVFDLTGSVFADDSTLLVDAVDGKIVGDVYTSVLRTSETKIALGENAGLTTQGVYAVAVGTDAGKTTQGTEAVAIGNDAGNTTQGAGAVAVGGAAGYTGQGEFGVAVGNDAGNTTQGYGATAVGNSSGSNTQGNFAVAIGFNAGTTSQGISAVAIGDTAGKTNQGEDSIAIGKEAGETNQAANSIVLNATGAAVENTTASSLVIKPIRGADGTSILQYNSTSGEVTYSSALGSVSGTFTGNIFTTLIDSSDSSAITITPAVFFSSDIIAENEITIQGSRVINLAGLKSVVAASTDFADFQIRIAALV